MTPLQAAIKDIERKRFSIEKFIRAQIAEQKIDS